MIAIVDNISELTTGGIFVVLVLKLVFDFLEKQKIKKGNGSSGQTQMFSRMSGDTHEIEHNISEIKDVLIAQPPRQSVVSTLSKVDESLRDQAQRQKETVHVLEEIRDVLKTHSKKLDDARCVEMGKKIA
ncbi:MAG: hypothetical protein VW907_08500 [Opitutae bacterium]